MGCFGSKNAVAAVLTVPSEIDNAEESERTPMRLAVDSAPKTINDTPMDDIPSLAFVVGTTHSPSPPTPPKEGEDEVKARLFVSATSASNDSDQSARSTRQQTPEELSLEEFGSPKREPPQEAVKQKPAALENVAPIVEEAPVEEEQERIQCPTCSRKFSKTRIERHMAACLKKEKKSRPTFDSKAQRTPMKLAPLTKLKSLSPPVEESRPAPVL